MRVRNRIEEYLPVFPSPALKVRSGDECAIPYLALLNFDILILTLSVLAASAIVRRDLCRMNPQLETRRRNVG